MDREERSISQRKLSRNVKTGRIMGVVCLEFREKTFADGGKIAKFMKVFSLESFLLYGNQHIYIHMQCKFDWKNSLASYN